MATFVVELHYNVDRDRREAVHAEHAAYLAQLTGSGTLLLAGPLVGTNAGLLVYETPDLEGLERILADEPYVRAGFVAERRISQWAPGKGSLLQTKSLT